MFLENMTHTNLHVKVFNKGPNSTSSPFFHCKLGNTKQQQIKSTGGMINLVVNCMSLFRRIIHVLQSSFNHPLQHRVIYLSVLH